MSNKKDVHLTGALAAVLNSGEVKNVEYYKSKSRDKKQSIDSRTSFDQLSQTESTFLNEKIIEMSPDIIINWAYHDRPESELGDIKTFAEELKSIGQQQPCIVRPSKQDKRQYEIIAGERRWRAAKVAGINLKVIVKNLTDKEAAICQAAENSHREDLSDYAKGMNYSSLIEKGIIDRKELQEKLKLSKSSIRNLLSFSRINQNIWDAIGDYSKISASTAYEISRLLSSDSNDYQKILLRLAPKLDGKNISDKKLRKLVELEISGNKTNFSYANEIRSTTGRHIFTWRKDSNGNRSIAFPKDVREVINFTELEKTITKNIENQLQRKRDNVNN
ncbi:ParB/RepB/Spo0J family partition protein [Candidiatus Paracoxiella cheracis]|uniref:ParB/RepB/Spo0J family partition protein n=1 Tax=Candidiatus Paracoxiella cheracis TaxID=3405120 RepID=UPI003BF4F420